MNSPAAPATPPSQVSKLSRLQRWMLERAQQNWERQRETYQRQLDEYVRQRRPRHGIDKVFDDSRHQDLQNAAVGVGTPDLYFSEVIRDYYGTPAPPTPPRLVARQMICNPDLYFERMAFDASSAIPTARYNTAYVAVCRAASRLRKRKLVRWNRGASHGRGKRAITLCKTTDERWLQRTREQDEKQQAEWDKLKLQRRRKG